jgi:glycosyltransferase involved in cell wall biosynthesis
VSKVFAEYFLSNSHSVYIYARPEPGRKIDLGSVAYREGLEVYFGKKTYSPVIKSLSSRDLMKWVTKNSLDLILFNEQHSFLEVESVKQMGIKTAAYIDYYREDTIELFSIYDLLICVTKRHYSVFDWHPGAIYMPWGVKPETFTSVESSRSFDFFHSCGNDPYRKGTDIFIKSLFSVSETTALIHTQTDLFKSLPQVSDELRCLIDSGRLTVVHDDISPPGLYGSGKIYAYPARLDGLGLTVCEALASGLPVVVTDSAPMNEFVNDKIGSVVATYKSWARSDGYYWPKVEVRPEVFGEALNDSLSLYKNGILKPEICRSYVYKERNIQHNFQPLDSIIGRLQFTPSLNQQLSNQIKYSPSSRFPIQYRSIYGVFFTLRGFYLKFRTFWNRRPRDYN